MAQAAKVTEIMSKDLTNVPGKEGLLITVEYPPGSSDPVHRHNAHGFIYVPEGTVVMQVKGGTLSAYAMTSHQTDSFASPSSTRCSSFGGVPGCHSLARCDTR
jgi:hypothetical protein